MHATKTVKGAFGSSSFFQHSEHPRIGYFSYKKLKAGSHRSRQRLRHRSVTVQRSTVIWR